MPMTDELIRRYANDLMDMGVPKYSALGLLAEFARELQHSGPDLSTHEARVKYCRTDPIISSFMACDPWGRRVGAIKALRAAGGIDPSTELYRIDLRVARDAVYEAYEL